MASRFDKNFTERGYTMSYLKMPDTVYSKSHVLQFLVEIKGITPRIWRRIQVPSNYNFWDLHVAIQDALGWWDSHLHHISMELMTSFRNIWYLLVDTKHVPNFALPFFHLGSEPSGIWKLIPSPER